MLQATDELLTASIISDATWAALSDVMAFAATAAAITCSRRGADLPRRNEVDTLGGPRGLAAAAA